MYPTCYNYKHSAKSAVLFGTMMSPTVGVWIWNDVQGKRTEVVLKESASVFPTNVPSVYQLEKTYQLVKKMLHHRQSAARRQSLVVYTHIPRSQTSLMRTPFYLFRCRLSRLVGQAARWECFNNQFSDGIFKKFVFIQWRGLGDAS